MPVAGRDMSKGELSLAEEWARSLLERTELLRPTGYNGTAEGRNHIA